MRLLSDVSWSAEFEGLIVGGYFSKVDYSMPSKLVLASLSVLVGLSTGLLETARVSS